MKHIVIIGGGIAGLTTAHELIDQDYKVTVIERNDIVGGLARTYQDEKTKTCPYEYSWRAYGKWYQNVFDIMKKIPFNDKTVYDNLVVLQGGDQTCFKKIPSYQNSFDKLSFLDYIKLFPIIFAYFCSCNERNIENFSKVGLRDHIHNTKLSKNAENFIGKIVGPYLGFDYHNASTYDLLYNYEMIMNNSSNEFEFSITSMPTNYAWLDPWVDLLKSKGLTLKLNTEVISINLVNGAIYDITMHDKINNIDIDIKGDYYINCTGPEILQKLFEPFALYPKIKPWYDSIEKVAKNGRQIQLSVYYYVNKKIFLENKNTLAYLPNTPWLLMVLPTGHIWGDNYLEKYCDEDIKEVISVGICEPYVNGLLIKKPWSECTKEEIEKETWYQLINDNDFKNNVCVGDNAKLTDVKIIKFKMWDSYQHKNGKLDTYEPKWANNINTIEYRPKTQTPVPNLFVAGSYSNTSTGTFSMESAAESGKIVAKIICAKDNKNECIYLHTKKTSFSTYPIRYIDSCIYNAPTELLFFLCIVTIIVLCLKIKK